MTVTFWLFHYIYYLFYYYIINCILAKYEISINRDYVRLKFGESGLLDKCPDL